MRIDGYLKMLPTTIFTKGYSRSIIYKCTPPHNFNHIPNTLFEFCREHNNCNIVDIYKSYNVEDFETIDEYIDWLLKNKFAVICKTKEKLTSFLDLKFEYLYPANISNALIEHSKDADYCNVFNLISSYGCRHIFIVSLDAISINELETIAANAEYTSIRSIEILCRHNQNIDINKLCDIVKTNSKIMRIVLHSSEKDKGYITSPNNHFLVSTIEKNINTHNDIFEITSATFSLTLNSYSESIGHNTFYNKKIIIDKNNTIRLNLTTSKEYGSLAKNTIETFLNDTDLKTIWQTSKDKIEVCKDCEYRFICLDYRVPDFSNTDSIKMNIPCSYNPYTLKWATK